MPSRIAGQPAVPRCGRYTTGGEEMAPSEKQSEGLMAKAMRAVDLVDYREGSVVSKEIINKGTGIITFFAFDEEQGLSEHTAPFDAFVYLLDGEADITLSGVTLRLKEGEMVIMPANKPHALKAVSKFKMMLVMIKS
ncbi:cupin domain-containing protein [Chloroflexota bacterium]